MMKKLQLSSLSDRHFGVTPAIAAAYYEAACVCFNRHHRSPAELTLIDNKSSEKAIAQWEDVTDRSKAGWANRDDATRDGAYAVALAAIEATRGLVGVARAETRTGCDYYLANLGVEVEDLESNIRFEVSGIDVGNETNIKRRLAEKIEQARAGNSDLPAIASVVGFAALQIISSDVSEK